MKELTCQWLKMRFNSHVVTDFCHQVSGEIPDLVMTYGWVTPFRTGQSMLNCEMHPCVGGNQIPQLGVW